MKNRRRKKLMKFYKINLGILMLAMVGCGIRERPPISLLPSIGVKGEEVHPLGVDFADYPDVSKEIDSLKTEDYAIKKGDSLWKISRDRKTSISILRQLNGIDGDLIREGQVIKVPFVEGADSSGKVIKKTDPEEKPAQVEVKEPSVEAPEAEEKPNDEGAAKQEEGPELLPIPEIEDDFALPVPEKP